MNDINSVKNDFVSIVIENGIVIVDFLDQSVNLEQAKKIVEMRLELIKENSYPVLVDGRKVVKLDKDARDYFSCPDAMKGVKAGGILIGSTFSKFLGNFFLRVTYKKKKLPTMIFTDKKVAMDWLGEYR